MNVPRGPALRARANPRLLDVLRERYGIGIASQPDVKDLGGSSNLNLLVTDADGRYVVRVYRPWVTTARLADIQRARETLDEGGVSSPRPIRTLGGMSWTSVDGRLVEIERYVEHDATMDSWERLALGLPLLGRVHSLLRPLRSSADGKRAPAANTIAAPAALAWTLAGTRRIRDWGPSPTESRLVAAAEDLARLVDAAERHVGSLPRQLVHGDFWDNNVFFRAGQPVLVTDLDFMGERPRIDDLALTLYYTNSTFTDDQVSDERVHRLRGLVDAYDSGLDEGLTAVERRALPLALARAPLCFIGMVAATDTEAKGRRLAAEMAEDVSWALDIARAPRRWQDAFA
ncbi:MAG: phosphotransferase [Chloroflexota bacterium]|nr:phosphotransferase [Chloroflexota bacterium]